MAKKKEKKVRNLRIRKKPKICVLGTSGHRGKIFKRYLEESN